MGFHIVEEKRKSGTMLIVRSSYRNENGKSTSVNCGSLGSLEEFKKAYGENYKDKAKELGNELYVKWKRNQADKFVLTTYADEEETENNVFYSSQFYLRKIWNQLGLPEFLSKIKKESKGKWKYDLNEVLFFLVSVQILNSTSKLGAYSTSESYYFKPKKLKLDSLYDCLDVLAKSMDYINNYTYKKVKKYINKDSKLFFYDVTTINMSQSVNENELIGIKKGKEGIFGPIIQIGYVCDQWGLLVGMYVFNGRSNEQSSLKEQIEKVFNADKCKNVVICTDAGLCSIKNKRYLENKFKGYIITQPLSYKKVPDFIRKWAIEDKFDNENKTKEEIINEYNQLISKEEKSEDDKKKINELYNKVFYKSRWCISEVKIYSDSNKKEETTFKELLKEKSTECLEAKSLTEENFKIGKKAKYKTVSYQQRLVVSFSLKYYFSQLKDLEDEKEKALNAVNKNYDIGSKSSKNFTRFVNSTKATSQGEVASEIINTFDEDKYNYEVSLCGLYCQATNLDDNAEDIYTYSRNRWQIEYAFRTAKTYQGFGTVYLQKINHILGHFEICFLAQEILKTLIYKVYSKIGCKDDMIGRKQNLDEKYKKDIFTIDRIINELANLKTLKIVDDNGRTFLKSLTPKNDINVVFAEIFDFSVTKKGQLLKHILDNINK